MYEDLWAEPEKGFRSVLKTLVSNPTFVLKHIFVEKKFWYLMHLLVPLAFLPVRRWYLWAALVPGAILTLLVTNYDPPIMFSFQYVMFWLPYLFLASVLALKALGRESQGPARAAAATVAMAVASAGLSFNYGAFPMRDRYFESGYHKIQFGWGEREESRYRDVKRLVASIPPHASVTTTEHIGPHLSARAPFYTLRRGTHDAEYMIASKSELRLNATTRAVKEALTDGKYGVQARFGEYVVFKRGADPGQNQDILTEWKLTTAKKRRSRGRAEQDEAAEADAVEREEAAEADGGEPPSKGKL
jgi:uncharacterized membrane protein